MGGMLVREFTHDDFDAICVVWNEIWPNTPKAREEMENDFATLDPRFRSHFFVAEIDEEIVGIAEIYRDIGSYHPQRWTLHVATKSTRQGEGIGKALYERGHAYIVEREPLSVDTRVHEDDPRALRFALERGYREIKRDFESLLSLADLDRGLLQSIESESLPNGVTIQSGESLDSPEFRRAFHRLFEEIRPDIPRSEPPTPIAFEFFQQQVLDDPSFLMKGAFFALREDELIGFTGMYEAHAPAWLDQWLTAVKREWRGQNLALKLKVHGLRWAIENDYTTIRTDNDTRNAPMLAINERFGFRRLPAFVTMRTVIADYSTNEAM